MDFELNSISLWRTIGTPSMGSFRRLTGQTDRPPRSAAELLTRYRAGERVFHNSQLAGANLESAMLEGIELYGSNLQGASLVGANLHGSDLRLVDFQNASLADAELVNSALVRTDLWKADLRGATFVPMLLDDSFLVQADLSSATIVASFDDVVVGLGTRFHTTSLAFADFTNVQLATETDATHQAAAEFGVSPEYALAGARCDVDIATLSNTAKMLRHDFGELNKRKASPESLARFFQDCGMGEEMFEVFFAQPLDKADDKPAEFEYDVFISFKNTDEFGTPTPDSRMAEDLYEFLTTRGLRVFMSNKTLEALGVSTFREAIDEALERSAILVVVASSPENAAARWVQYEWGTFIQDMLSGLKPQAQVFNYTLNVAPQRLPRGLRQYQAFSRGDEGMDRLHRFIRNSLTAAA